MPVEIEIPVEGESPTGVAATWRTGVGDEPRRTHEDQMKTQMMMLLHVDMNACGLMPVDATVHRMYNGSSMKTWLLQRSAFVKYLKLNKENT